jgi:hypothetical protein
MNKPVILAAGTPQVLLPYDNANLFVRNLTKHKGPLATWTAWQVPKTMRPADVAKQLGMPESTLREVNRIPPKMLVKAGSTLLVHRSEHRERDVSEALADNAMMALAPDVPQAGPQGQGPQGQDRGGKRQEEQLEGARRGLKPHGPGPRGQRTLTLRQGWGLSQVLSPSRHRSLSQPAT